MIPERFSYHQITDWAKAPDDQKQRPLELSEVIRVLEAQIDLLASSLGVTEADLLKEIAKVYKARMERYRIPF